MFRYTAMRFGLFVACFAVIWGLVALRILPAGLGSSNLLWVALLALVISAPLSFVLLRGARDAARPRRSPRALSAAGRTSPRTRARRTTRTTPRAPRSTS
ncbi:hypothetical protein M2266_004137 [Streptomyces sp. SPB162]|nr:hypothetical protein [Streptomyces sp. SPB162]